MSSTKVDPLGHVPMYWLWKHSQTLCNCPAKHDRNMMHADYCGMSPIYAELVKKYPDVYWRLWLDLTKLSQQHLIKCAECGRERLGRDLDTVWQAHPGSVTVQSEREIKRNIKNIVKAVCPEHNRKGTVGWRYAGVTD